MPSSSSTFLLFLLAFRLANGRPWNGPEKTLAYQGDQWSPRPTAIPVNPRDLFERAQHESIAVCGWVGGNSASPVACGKESFCIHDTAHGVVGCCSTSGPCSTGVYNSCFDDSSEIPASELGMVNNGITTCGSGLVCYQNTYPGGAIQFNCGTATDQGGTVLTSFSGQPSDLLLQIVYTGVVFSPSSALTTTTSSSSSTSQPSTSESSTTSTSTPNTVAHPPAATATTEVHSSSNTKSIIGGVVGGLALLTAVLGVLLFLLQRRHTKRSQMRGGGSFVNGKKEGQRSPYGPFQRIQPYSPDDFNSSHNVGPTPSTIAAAFPNNHLTPPLPNAEQPFLSPPLLSPPTLVPLNPIGEEPRNREDSEDAPLVSEIDQFSMTYNQATRYHQEPRDLTEPGHHIETVPFEDPPFALQYNIAAADPGPIDIPAAVTAGGLTVPLRRTSGRSEKDRARDRLMGEDKEGDGGSPEPARQTESTYVREAEWARPREREVPSNVQRYQLVDDVPRGTVPVLHSPGQLRGGARRGGGGGGGAVKGGGEKS